MTETTHGVESLTDGVYSVEEEAERTFLLANGGVNVLVWL